MQVSKLSGALLFFAAYVYSLNAFSADTRSESQKTFDSNYDNAKRVSERQKQEATKEQMRDKTHDNRLKVGSDTSVGVSTNPPGVNVRKSTP